MKKKSFIFFCYINSNQYKSTFQYANQESISINFSQIIQEIIIILSQYSFHNKLMKPVSSLNSKRVLQVKQWEELLKNLHSYCNNPNNKCQSYVNWEYSSYYNGILAKLQGNHKIEEQEIVLQRVLNSATWKPQYQVQIRNSFRNKTANIIINCMQVQNKHYEISTKTVETLNSFLNRYPRYKNISPDNAINELKLLINQIETYENLIKSIAQYPDKAKNQNLKKIVDEWAFTTTKEELKKIYTLKNQMLLSEVLSGKIMEKIGKIQRDANYWSKYPQKRNCRLNQCLTRIDQKMKEVHEAIYLYKTFTDRLFSNLPYQDQKKSYQGKQSWKCPLEACLTYLKNKLRFNISTTLTLQSQQGLQISEYNSETQQDKVVRLQDALVQEKLKHNQLKQSWNAIYYNICIIDSEYNENYSFQNTKELLSQKQQILEKIAKLKTTQKQVRNRMQQDRNQHNQRFEEQKRLKKDNELFKQSNPDLSSQLLNCKDTIFKQISQIDRLSKQNQALKNKIQQTARILCSNRNQKPADKTYQDQHIQLIKSAFKDLKEQYSKFKSQSHFYSIQNTNLKQEKQQLQKNNNQQKQEKLNLLKKLQDLEQHKKTLQQQINSQKQINKNAFKQIQQLFQIKERVQKQLNNLKQEIKTLYSKANLQNQEKQKLLKLVKDLQKKNNIITTQKAQICNVNQQLKRQIGGLGIQMDKKKQQIQNIRKQIKQKELEHQTYAQDINRLNKQSRELKNQIEISRFQAFNRKSLIYNHPDLPHKVITQIQALTQNNIQKVNCLLLFDKKSSVSKVDEKPLFNQPNTVHIIKIATKIVVSFIDIPLLKEKGTNEGPQKSFIMVFSDNGCQVFHPKDNKVSFQFIHDMIVIGKSDLRIDLNNPKLTSLLGSNESQFNTQKRKAKEILGGDQASIQGMEFYHIIFRQQKKSSQIIQQEFKPESAMMSQETVNKSQIKFQKNYAEENHDNSVIIDLKEQDNEQFKQNLQKYYETFKGCMDKSQKQFDNIHKKMKQHHHHNENILQNLKKVKSRIGKIQQNIRQKQKSLQSANSQIQLLTSQMENIRSLKDELKVLKIQLTQKDKNILKLKSQLEDLTKQQNNLNEEIRRQKSNIKNLKISLQTSLNEMKNKDLEIESLKMRDASIENVNSSKISQLQKDKKQLQIHLSSKERENANLNEKLYSSCQEIQKLKHQLKLTNQELDKQIKKLDSVKVSNNENITDKNKKNSSRILLQKNQIRQNIEKEFGQKLETYIEQHTQRLRQWYFERYSTLSNGNSENELSQVYLAYIDRFFQGELLESLIRQKHRLIWHLQTFMGRNITKTRLLYKLDLRTNFHDYIDGTTSLVLIVKLVNKFCLAGFYSGTYAERQMADPGLLISLTNNESFQLRIPDPQSNTKFRAMGYDRYFLLFGNSEMRIRVKETLFFSNFGINNSYFNSRGKKYQEFIGGDNREVQMESYEIYEVTFDHEEKQ